MLNSYAITEKRTDETACLDNHIRVVDVFFGYILVLFVVEKERSRIYALHMGGLPRFQSSSYSSCQTPTDRSSLRVAVGACSVSSTL